MNSPCASPGWPCTPLHVAGPCQGAPEEQAGWVVHPAGGCVLRHTRQRQTGGGPLQAVRLRGAVFQASALKPADLSVGVRASRLCQETCWCGPNLLTQHPTGRHPAAVAALAPLLLLLLLLHGSNPLTLTNGLRALSAVCLHELCLPCICLLVCWPCRIQGHPTTEVGRKARQLVFGFQAMVSCPNLLPESPT